MTDYIKTDITIPAPNPRRRLFYFGTSLEDQGRLPVSVNETFADSLSAAVRGEHPSGAKPWKGEGPGIFELVENYHGGAYRAIYTIRFAEAVYVLHVFEKKSKRGIKTPQLEIEKVRARLKLAREHYAKTFEK